ncbi:Protein of unknown function, partial [Cotesia congregata]
MTFIRRNSLCPCDKKKLPFKSLLAYVVIGLLATEKITATTQFPTISKCHKKNAHVSNLDSVLNTPPMNSTEEIKRANEIKVNQDETFNPDSVLIKPSDRILLPVFNETENTKFISAKRKNSSNQTLINLHKVKPLKVNASELPAARFIPKLPAHQQLKNISK